jgi:Flp pilus assembly protein TadD
MQSRILPAGPLALLWPIRIGLASIIILTAVAYSPALRAPLIFDDIASIGTNATLRTVWPLSIPLSPPPNTPVSGRPIANLSFAINRAASDVQPSELTANVAPADTVGFHLVNLALHILSGLLLFGIIRRTCVLVGRSASRDGNSIGLFVTAIWLVHPIQTEAVNYLTQRTELLVSLFYLGVIYSSIRSWDAGTTRRRLGWCALGVVACLLGTGSKEVIVGAPVMVLLYDRAFRATSWRALFQTPWRRWYYVTLFAALAPLIWLVGASNRVTTSSAGPATSWFSYLLTQGWAIAHYLRLTLIPVGLTLDYGTRVVSFAHAIPGVIVVAVLGLATVGAWMRLVEWRVLAFCGAWFFIVLAPSSSVIAISSEIAAERRIYLALTAVIVAVCVGASRAVGKIRDMRGTPPPSPPGLGASRRRWMHVGGISLAAALAVLTFFRSRLYADPEALWRDTVAKQPANARALNNLGTLIADRPGGDSAETTALFQRAVTADSTYAPGWYNLATDAINAHRFAEAESLLRTAVRFSPDDAPSLSRLGALLLARGDLPDAIGMLQRASRNGENISTEVALGAALQRVGRVDDAIAAYRRAIAIDSTRPDIAGRLGMLLAQQKDPAEAIPLLEFAASAPSASADVLASLGMAEIGVGRSAAARPFLERALAIDSGNAAAKDALGQINGHPR